jgi:hypothetical protein
MSEYNCCIVTGALINATPTCMKLTSRVCTSMSLCQMKCDSYDDWITSYLSLDQTYHGLHEAVYERKSKFRGSTYQRRSEIGVSAFTGRTDKFTALRS